MKPRKFPLLSKGHCVRTVHNSQENVMVIFINKMAKKIFKMNLLYIMTKQLKNLALKAVCSV